MNNSNKSHELEFEDALEETDFGLIVCGKTGRLKGLWIPKDLDDEEVPESLVRICVDVFGIDEKEFFETEETSDGQTLH